MPLLSRIYFELYLLSTDLYLLASADRAPLFSGLKTEGLPAKFDWRDKAMVAPVQNQQAVRFTQTYNRHSFGRDKKLQIHNWFGWCSSNLLFIYLHKINVPSRYLIIWSVILMQIHLFLLQWKIQNMWICRYCSFEEFKLGKAKLTFFSFYI